MSLDLIEKGVSISENSEPNEVGEEEVGVGRGHPLRAHIYHNQAPYTTALARAPSHLTDAQRIRTHFTPQHWLLCHMGQYKIEFEFQLNLTIAIPHYL